MRTVLHTKCDRITHAHINNIMTIPWFVRAIEAFDGVYNDENICDIICTSVREITPENPYYYIAFEMARNVYRDIYGEFPAFRSLPPDELTDTQRKLYEVLDGLPSKMRRMLIRSPEFLKAAEERGPITSFIQAYYAFEAAFFWMIYKQYKNHKDVNRRDWYLVFRKIANKYCSLVFDDPSVWRERLHAKLN